MGVFRVNLLISVFTFLLLAACARAPLVAFQDYQPKNVDGPVQSASQSGAKLTLWGIFALNKNVIFLYGGFTTPPGTLRSVLLRSSDGGRHWKEVMQPETGSEITELVFLPDGQGWAVAMWTIEGPGRTLLFHSDDSGAHWQKVSEFPLFGLGGHSFPTGLQFQNTMQGSVRILCIITLACCRYDTEDGGLTWHKTDDCLGEHDCLFKTPHECSLDQTSWKYSVAPAEAVIKISQRTSMEGFWTEISKLPMQYGYADGKILLP